ncbi:phage virion morphogenesis protein [Enterobacter quasiroggenkampii]|uniref:phage virion morphogenesis protein n=1 Tax=Enterobacter quasiroggenkampii TaxID=2497436 RepID=UPI0039C0E003
MTGLIAVLSPVGRRWMAANIVKKLCTSQQGRIKTQKASACTPYAAPKCQPIRFKKGRIKREMIVKLYTNRYMKPSAATRR